MTLKCDTLPKHGSINRRILIRRFYLNLFSLSVNENIYMQCRSTWFLLFVYTGARLSPEVQLLLPFFTKKILSWLLSTNAWYQPFVANNSNLVKVTHFLPTSSVIG